MSALADRRREERRRSMLPGSSRDMVVNAAKWVLPGATLALLAVLVALPLATTQEFSFLLSKDSAARAGERMRVQEASYRGETSRGEPFEIMARSGVQKTSAVPVVVLEGLSAEIRQATGPATVTAPRGEFFIEENRLLVSGPVVARSTSGYSLDADRIEVDINESRVSTDQPVSGQLPMGQFRANRFSADIEGRHVILSGGVSLRINPNRMRS
jgi:lipopolysaccharide export system protein LptC